MENGLIMSLVCHISRVDPGGNTLTPRSTLKTKTLLQ